MDFKPRLNRDYAERLLEAFEARLAELTPPKKRSDTFVAEMLKQDIELLKEALSKGEELI